MTRIKDLKNENYHLKKKIERLEEWIDRRSVKNYEVVDMGLSSHVDVIKYLRDDDYWFNEMYQVSSKVVSKRFVSDGRLNEPTLAAKYAERQVQDAFTKEAFDWLIETQNPHDVEKFNFYLDRNIPIDSVFINPKNVMEFVQRYVTLKEEVLRRLYLRTMENEK
jgi:hypothetical protein